MGAEEILLESPLMHPACWPKFGPQCLREEFSWWPSSSKVPMLPSSCLTVSHEHRASEFLPPVPLQCPIVVTPCKHPEAPPPKASGNLCEGEAPKKPPRASEDPQVSNFAEPERREPAGTAGDSPCCEAAATAFLCLLLPLSFSFS